MTIVEFLEVRLAEDEVYARLNTTVDDSTGATEYAYLAAERTLREVAAKRRIIRHSATWDLYPSQVPQALRVVLRYLALVYADHPDFDPDWAV